MSVTHVADTVEFPRIFVPSQSGGMEIDMLEKMNEFFEARLDGYDDHMMTNIESAGEFYPFTASLLPQEDGAEAEFFI